MFEIVDGRTSKDHLKSGLELQLLKPDNCNDENKEVPKMHKSLRREALLIPNQFLECFMEIYCNF